MPQIIPRGPNLPPPSFPRRACPRVGGGGNPSPTGCATVTPEAVRYAPRPNQAVDLGAAPGVAFGIRGGGMGLFPPRRPLHNRHGCENEPHAPHTVVPAQSLPPRSRGRESRPRLIKGSSLQNRPFTLTRQRELRKGLPRGKIEIEGPARRCCGRRSPGRGEGAATRPVRPECPDASSGCIEGPAQRCCARQSPGTGGAVATLPVRPECPDASSGCIEGPAQRCCARRSPGRCCGGQHACAILRTWNPSPRSLPIPFRQARLGTQPIISHRGVPTQIGRIWNRVFHLRARCSTRQIQTEQNGTVFSEKTGLGLDALSWPFAPSRKRYNGRAAMPFRRG